ncbi:biopolymer transporter ExbD [Pseudohongiella sp. SYSU M77423]|uniref:ExbD/TolR family protein n=1 Tax=unclassified Pseudohongiella TaxID=2629611 RepID=UPI000C3E2A2A|nr:MULTISPECIES: biopolymer transporter ExbD [unclassified Pseudohongiella]MAY57209.1 biopolymer transporter ExbD [Gammaproteobacteria bacterium]MEC8859795.1 biopolymer transporter ExbD [Pseudomonadota bacterium]HBN13423.1 biopolymer transporter ExbD [Pseudohongiella sp.]MBJ53884.1 biopolymer transporter ExbD [Gammaproteobacteria bacterium]MDH7942404.1 biopolymer transporter ExbD [Pseudohongiella sp. SYSU M77423]|tara:strand:+ start:182 stop:595 length:414 start_codon:yes stop_codon:yes gene_type:complete
MKKLAGERKKDESNVDLTPMLDVVFILLIFFVVTATFLSEQAIDAASNENNETPPEQNDDLKNILVELSQNNEIRFNGEPRAVLPSQIRANIDRLKAENPSASVIIQPDNRSNVETMVMVMDAARQAGIYNISVVEP